MFLCCLCLGLSGLEFAFGLHLNCTLFFLCKCNNNYTTWNTVFFKSDGFYQILDLAQNDEMFLILMLLSSLRLGFQNSISSVWRCFTLLFFLKYFLKFFRSFPVMLLCKCILWACCLRSVLLWLCFIIFLIVSIECHENFRQCSFCDF